MNRGIINAIPSGITILNLMCGFSAIMISDLYKSSILIICCLFLDALDGMVARALNAQSDIGRELDSLADLMSFGIAPAFLYFQLAPERSWAAFIPPLFLVSASALRLAKFNLLPSSKYFTGLPTPATAFFMIGIFLSYHFNKPFVVDLVHKWAIYWIIPAFFAFIMLSRLQMFSLKGIDKSFKNSKFQLILLVLFLVLVLMDNKLASSISVLVYIILSFIQSIRSRA